MLLSQTNKIGWVEGGGWGGRRKRRGQVGEEGARVGGGGAERRGAGRGEVAATPALRLSLCTLPRSLHNYADRSVPPTSEVQVWERRGARRRRAEMREERCAQRVSCGEA